VRSGFWIGSGAGGGGELGSRELGVCGIWRVEEREERDVGLSTEEGVCGICPPGECVEYETGVSTGDEEVREGSKK